MISLNDVLLAMSNIPVDDPIAEIWGRGLQGGYKIIEYTGSLPITINASGDALIDYRIYGADGGVGERTENLYNKNDPDIVFSAYMDYGGTIRTGGYGDTVKVSGYIPINGGQKYTGTNLMDSGHGNYYAYYDTNKQLLGTGQVTNNMVFNSPVNAAYIRTTLIHRNSEDIAMVTEGPTVPESYIPYGYKLPMTVGDGNTAQTVPVYIGENQLTEGEYVSYGEQKIYRDVSGTLTPTDPPVPLPQILTIDGTTIIDYDGDPKPSQMYIKYKGKG